MKHIFKSPIRLFGEQYYETHLLALSARCEMPVAFKFRKTESSSPSLRLLSICLTSACVRPSVPTEGSELKVRAISLSSAHNSFLNASPDIVLVTFVIPLYDESVLYNRFTSA